jgi:phospholipid/cholesterol/gamma-HCH transport system substrate-binding protein
VQVSKGKLAAVVAAVIVLSGIALVLIKPQALSPGYFTLRTFTDDASGLMDGTPVRLDGIRVGYLDTQKLTASRDLRRKVELTLKISSNYLAKIPADSVAGLAADNLLGDQYISIHRGHAGQPIAAGSELAAMQSRDITKMMARLSQEFDEFQAIAVRADQLLTTVNAGGGGALGKLKQDPTIKQSATAATELDRLVNDIQHGHGTLTKLFFDDPIAAQMDSPMKRIDAVMADANATTGKLKDFTQGMDDVSAEIRSLQDTVKAGKGTLGGLDELQQRFGELSGKVAAMQDRINSGQGTLGQFLVNPQLNNAIAGTTHEFQELAKGLKANPRKFIALRLF